MKRSTARWSTALAAAAWLAVPIGTAAQTPGSQQPVPQQPTTTQPTTQQPTAGAHAQHDQHGSPQEHLRKAEAALNDIPAASLTGTAKARVAELKRHINAIERAAGKKASDTGEAKRGEDAPSAKSQGSWSTEVAAADRILTELLGTPSTTSGAPTGTTGTTGAKSEASITLDETTRAKLMEVRSNLTAFAAAMGNTTSPSPRGDSADTAAAQPSSSPATSSTPSTSATTATGSPASTSGAQQPGAEAQQGQAEQVDPEAAKRHLTAARNTLSEITQLPAASQLSGEPRTQVSQLISNFNELITTDSEWRESYAKVDANLTALIGAETTDESQTPATSTAGAVGTTGTATGSLDPAIREKLVEFRTHLKQFEMAAGGADTSASPGDTGASSTANPGSMTNPGSTPNPTGSAYPSSPSTSTPGTTPEQTAGAPQSSSQAGAEQTGRQAGSQQPSAPEGHSEAERHIAAIEAILSGQSPDAAEAPSPAGTTGTTGTTGSTGAANPTLDPAQIEQIRTHLAELRRLLNEAAERR